MRKLKKSLIVYNEAEIKRAQSVLESRLSQEEEKTRLKAIMDETWDCIKERQVHFSRLDMIFSKLLKKNFNIVVREKDAEDITITITPHHEKKYGRDILNRINIAITTEKIQADKPLDKKEFMVMMQGYDKNMEKI